MDDQNTRNILRELKNLIAIMVSDRWKDAVLDAITLIEQQQKEIRKLKKARR